MLASRFDGVQLWAVAVGALFYSGLRFLEAVGLWKDRNWAKWLGAISGGIYIPVEIYEAARMATAPTIGSVRSERRGGRISALESVAE